MTRLILLILTVVLCRFTHAQADIIPQPVAVQFGTGQFTIDTNTIILIGSEGNRSSADIFIHYLQKHFAIKPAVVTTAPPPGKKTISMVTRTFIQAPANPEGYDLNVTPTNITIEGNSHAATFYGVQTLLQLLPAAGYHAKVPVVKIHDQPAFDYRGMHLDVSRHFFSVEYIKKYIDFLALHKLNTFHWHLTDDQGWRIEIKKYPLLTFVGGYRNGTIIGRYPGNGNDGQRYGGFYTQEEIKEVIQYAADRFITIIPEIDIPGHTSAAIAAYPYLSCFPNEPTQPPAGTAWAGSIKTKQVQQAWGVFHDVLCAGKESTFQFLEDVFTEVAALFPATMIHIGGDENEMSQWKRCPHCQQRMKENNLKNEKELQWWMMQRMQTFLQSKGKQVIGWDEILEGGIAPGAIVMSWRGERGGREAARKKHQAIMVPENYLYFNWSQTLDEDSVSFGRYTPIQKVYDYHPVPKGLDNEQEKYILGGQGALWTEYIRNTSILEYNLFPRLAALSEILWSKEKDWDDFEKRLKTQLQGYQSWGINYSKAWFEIKYSLLPASNQQGLMLQLDEYKHKDRVKLLFLNKDTSEIPFAGKTVLTEGGRYWLIALPTTETRELPDTITTVIDLHFNKATGKNINLKDQPSSTYPGKGPFGLVNGMKAKDFNSKEWLGFSGKDLQATIDLGKMETIKKVTVGAWKQEPSWVYLPVALTVSTSADGKSWKTYQVDQNNKNWKVINNREIVFPLPTAIKARYVRVTVKNKGKIETGKPGAGRNAWLFVDEIAID